MSSTYRQTVLASTPVGYWRLDEQSGTSAVDLSGNNNTGTYTGGVTLQQVGAVGDGTYSTKFDGVDGWITIPDSASLSPTAAVTVEAWVMPTAFPPSAANGIVCKDVGGTTSTNPAYVLQIDQFGKAVFGINSLPDTFTTATASSALTLNRWSHVVGTYDGANMFLYVNGVQVATTAVVVAIDNTTGTLNIGRQKTTAVTTRFWSGRIDEVAVYSTALTAATILTRYNIGLRRPSVYENMILQAGPLGYWRLNETAGTTITDLSGNGYHAVATALNTYRVASALGDGTTGITTGDGVSNASASVAALGGPNPNDIITVEYWFKGTDNASEFSPAGPNRATFDPNGLPLDAGMGGWGMSKRGVSPNGSIGVRIDTTTATNQVKIIPGVVWDGAWHHLAIVLNNGNFIWYKDGVSVSSGTYSHGAGFGNAAASFVVFGANSPNICSVDEVAVYGRELTAREIAAHYFVGKTRSKSGAWRKFVRSMTTPTTQNAFDALRTFYSKPNAFASTLKSMFLKKQ
jgi:hypothetical protein